MHTSWATGSLAGGVVGATLLAGLKGLDFILTTLFVVLTIDAFRASPDRLTLALAGAAGVIAILALYCLTRIDVLGPAHGLPQVIGVAVTVAVHLWRRNAVLSIVAGTTTCLILVNTHALS